MFFFFDRQEQCNVLAELTREYQMLKSAIGSVMESAEPLYDISSVLKDHEETKRCLSKVRTKVQSLSTYRLISSSRHSQLPFLHPQHEAAKTAMADKQQQLDRFSSKGKQLAVELKKVPECDSQMVRKETETLVDQWLDVRKSRLSSAHCGN